MPPHTKMPRPEGHVCFSYSPMSPPNWDIVPAQLHTFVYRDVNLALQAMLQAATTLHARRIENGTASLFTDNLYFRGQSDITHRLLPTRLRGPRREPSVRKRYRVDAPPTIKFNGIEFPSRTFRAPPGLDPKDHFGDWYEEVKPTRVVEAAADELLKLPENDSLAQRDLRENAAVGRAARLPAVAQLNDFQKRAAVRHYSATPSPLLDVSTNPEVAAFFATGGGGKKPPPVGQIGILWAIDLNFLDTLFSIEIGRAAEGLKIKLRETRDKWGANKPMFEEHGIQPTSLEMTAVTLPFRRLQAQQARFFSLQAGDGAALPPLLTELTWWSIIERAAVISCAFIQDGRTYENPGHNITQAALLPGDEELAVALGQAPDRDGGD